MKNDVAGAIERHKIILVIRGYTGEELFRVADACLAGGIRLMEVPFSYAGTPSDAQTAQTVRALREKYDGRICIGAGTVLTTGQAKLAADAGAQYLVSPVTDPEVISCTRELGLVSVAGAMTPTEILRAHRAGADFVKVFPAAQAGGPAYIRAVLAPLSTVRLIAFGGVKTEEIPAYLDAGAAGIGIASEVLNRGMIAAGDFEGITALARRCTAAVPLKKP